jgi:hypothetical protein
MPRRIRDTSGVVSVRAPHGRGRTGIARVVACVELLIVQDVYRISRPWEGTAGPGVRPHHRATHEWTKIAYNGASRKR